jgi:serine/threonine protein kinase
MIMELVDLVKDEENYPYIIMEKCKKTVGHIIKDYDGESIPEKHVLKMFTLMCIPLHFLHSKKMTHGNLKPDNFL